MSNAPKLAWSRLIGWLKQQLSGDKKAPTDAGAVLKKTDAFPETPPATVAECPKTNCMDIDKTVQHLQDNAEDKSVGRCAKYVRLAIEAGGVALDPATRPVSAKDYGPYLEKHGFKAVSSDKYTPQKGDIVVIQGFDEVQDDDGNVLYKARPHGHIQMWDGERWVSDFNQKQDIYPGSGYRNQQPAYKIYRSPQAVTSD